MAFFRASSQIIGNVFTQRQNELVSMLVYLASENKDGSATIEYYEDFDTPTFTKQITWTGGWPYFK